MKSRKTILTNGDVARICQVAPRTASRWFDSGRLKGYRLPGSPDRRIPRDSLLRFLREHGMDLPPELCAPRLLVLTCRPEVAGMLAALLGRLWDVRYARDFFEAGLLMSPAPAAALLDLACGPAGCARVRLYLAGAADCPPVFALAAEDDTDTAALLQAGYEGAWAWPCDLTLVAAAIAGSITEGAS